MVEDSVVECIEWWRGCLGERIVLLSSLSGGRIVSLSVLLSLC